MEKYKAIIIGSGQGGTPLSKKLANAGWKTALIEKDLIGGTCVNVGCTPTKTMIASARVAHLVARAADFGISTTPPAVNIHKVLEIKNDVVGRFRGGSEKGLSQTENLTLIHGEASFTGPKTIRVNNTDLEAEYIIIDTGARPKIPLIEGLTEADYLTSTTMLELPEIPRHLVIVGVNYIALEYGQMYRRFGSEVTILERSGRLLTKEDDDVAEEMRKILEDEGIKFRFDTEPARFARRDGGFDLTDKNGAVISGTHLLIAAGRKPNSDQLNLESAGVKTNEKGYVTVNEKLETTASGIYAIGDVNGGPAFTHISYNDYIILAANLLDGEDRTTAGRPLPYCVFTDPQLARIGITETEVKRQNLPVRVVCMPMEQVARAIETNEKRGLMKAVVAKDSDKILGAAIIGTEAGEVMTIIQMAMLGNIGARQIREMVFAHPLYAESLNNLFLKLESGK